MAFHRIFVVDFAGVGLGEAPDANRFQSVGADTLGHVAVSWPDKLNLPTLQQLGLGNIRVDHPIPGVEPIDQPSGFYGRLHVQAQDNRRATGLREMWDFTGENRTETVFASLPAAGYAVSLAGPFLSYLQTQSAAQRFQIGSNQDAFRVLYDRLYQPASGLAYVVLPDFRFAGEQQDVAAFAEALTSADHYLAQVQHDLGANDLLIVTATHADDPTVSATPTREYLPLLAYSPSRPVGHALGIRRTLADVGATVLENFGLAGHAAGHSFLNEITQ
ncbi:phosphopentomutase [Levilactobacillus brevis]|uniref:phosphopentomutase n=1 Tax=Levilactobacillus brevis TaxID=1580 RepID=UPI0005AA576F|nr:phosphopentomutase [Levilactobacillus brevis]MCB4357483.1 phosphopentomutase [Levilactobacillus brevis]MCT3590339.1 phosphopentomutase [Levilactobacillus brevis]RDF13206.1 phosphopentomutase [Levilactobacillus brevis]